MPIFINTEHKSFKKYKEKSIIKWLEFVILEEEKIPGIITYIFIGDEELLKINMRFLNHDYYTDVVAFDYSEEKEIIGGDIFISYDRIIENSEKFGVSVFNEQLRVMVHGLLHLIGYNDGNEYEKNIMTKKEDLYLNSFGEL